MFVNNENAAWRRTYERSDCQLCEIYNKQYITNKFYFESIYNFSINKNSLPFMYVLWLRQVFQYTES